MRLKIGVPQGSVSGPFFFNVFVNVILHLVHDTEVCNYADDTILYVGDSLKAKLSKLEKIRPYYLNDFIHFHFSLFIHGGPINQ